MPSTFSRRHFLQSGLLMGAALGLNLPALSLLPEGDPNGGGPSQLELTGSISPVHDPSIIKAGDRYYIFCTGYGIEVRRSADLLTWRMALPPVVLPGVPDWARELIPGSSNIWAPDISYYNDKYHLYYSVSTFGSNHSAIGLATNVTLDREEDGYQWVDEGLVIKSVRANNYNCIDPNLILDEEGVPWLSFGSFWSGIKMRRLDYETGKPSSEDPRLYNLAYRPTNHNSVEAPFIIRKGDFYYLFVSFDSCCQGVNSTYRVMVGRSETVTGPYVDRDGVEMMSGGGTQVTYPTERWKGPGHCSILQEEDTEYIVYHAYDAENNGTPTLRIDPLVWDEDGWPSIEGQGPEA